MCYASRFMLVSREFLQSPLADTPDSDTVILACAIGSLNLRGPALPGFRYKTSSTSLTFGRCECLEITTSIPAYTGSMLRSLRLNKTYRYLPSTAVTSISGYFLAH